MNNSEGNEDNKLKKTFKKMADSTDFDDFADKLQEYIDEEEKEVYSEIVRREYRYPVNIGRIEDRNGFNRVKGSCGDTMQFFIKIKDKILENVKFQTDGCGITIAAGSKLTKIVMGKNIDEIMKMESQDLTDALHGLPPEHLHCSALAMDTLKGAIENYLKNNSK
ncbi:MAG: iron-sulfur cluster assembly scaffold protein [Promethearchaeota archaeon]